ncbi:MAG: GMC family oxidoreductase [Alphaproteobacteria bacterium]|nr:GMC family oxidoreductase [Alphaproteobacteria bacterium]
MIAVLEGHRLERDVDRSCDVCIVGSGAGGSVLAARLAEAGLDVVVLEEGGFHTRADFERPDERWSYPNLYQDRGGRSTADLAITVLQGRAVGGGTLINWTTCFRTPERILDHWAREHGCTLTAEALAPSFAAVEARLGIQTWPRALANGNNSVLERGCTALGWEWQALRRNVRGCADSGMCGLGCPVDGKQAMHLTYLADATDLGATVYSDVRAERLVTERGRVVRVEAVSMQRGADRPGAVRLTLRPKLTVVSGGAINSPALLLRSGFGHPMLGRRTFLHPVIAVLGRYEEVIAPFAGAPQSISSHHFIGREPMGFFMEVAPMQPMLTASAGWASGPELMELMGSLPHLSGIIALHVDGLAPGDEGGTVRVPPGGWRMRLDYPVREHLVDAMRASHRAAAEVHFAAGASEVITTHRDVLRMTDRARIDALDTRPYGAQEHGIFTAHQMGGCGMGADPARHVVDTELRVRGVDGLCVLDGSVLPTALGVNPSETIYALAHHMGPRLAGLV